MPEFVFITILFAALLHAAWNAMVKSTPDKYLTAVLVTGTAAIFALLLIPFFPMPAAASWPFLLVSALLLQPVYFTLLAKSYHMADMSQVYPLMRGSAPLIVAIASILLFGESLNSVVWIGIILLCCGILCMLFSSRKVQAKAVFWALVNAVIIASYTLIDAAGVRRSDSVIAYSLWGFVLTGFWMLVSMASRYRPQDLNYFKKYWHLGIIGGICNIASYSLALWAMTLAPVAMVAALRESSILFALLISACILKEKVGVIRLLSAVIIVLGILILRLA